MSAPDLFFLHSLLFFGVPLNRMQSFFQEDLYHFKAGMSMSENLIDQYAIHIGKEELWAMVTKQ